MFSSLPYRLARAQQAVSLPHDAAHLKPVGSLIVTARSFPRPKNHQRRLSSSSSRSSNASKNGAQLSPSTVQKPESEKRASGRRGARLGSVIKIEDERFARLPSVPSTQHVHPADVAISAFFSLHRPISVTASVPIIHENSSFEKIFSSRKRGNYKPSEVISTLSQAVEDLNGKVGESEDLANTEPVSIFAPDSSLSEVARNSPLQLPSHVMSGKYRPFNAPPPPNPITDSAQAVRSRSTNVRRKTYSAVFTVFEQTDASGDKTYTTSASPIVAEEIDDSAGRSHMLERTQDNWDGFNSNMIDHESPDGQPTMIAISVRRQRKLKMKKHKYKKLMRRTRTLRRKLDKL